MPEGIENRVREVRQARAVPQADLARRCGLSRQALSAIEAGRYVPNTAVALRLARVLGCAVEDLFAPRQVHPTEVRVADPASGVGRVRVGRVRDQLVAWPLWGADAGWPADGMLAAPGAPRSDLKWFPGAAPPDRVLFVAGCDPALRLAGALVEQAADVRVHWLPLGSARALRAVADGLVHLAGTHLHPPGDPHGVRTIRRLLGGRAAVVVSVARWVEGLMLRPGLAGRVRNPHDLLPRGMRMVNREVGSGTRAVLDQWLQDAGVEPTLVRGYRLELRSHLAVAEAVFAGLADAGPGVLPVARLYGLEFLPLAEQRYDLVVPRDLVDLQPVRVLLDVLTGRRFHQELVSIGGYDPSPAGSTRVLS
ncbi:MAG: helix-turn-helix domain-containing protein [Firmicutes bacterium]|nr:helix-turn-helix domain-containing protein [Bacillota bacterium]